MADFRTVDFFQSSVNDVNFNLGRSIRNYAANISNHHLAIVANRKPTRDIALCFLQTRDSVMETKSGPAPIAPALGKVETQITPVI